MCGVGLRDENWVGGLPEELFDESKCYVRVWKC